MGPVFFEGREVEEEEEEEKEDEEELLYTKIRGDREKSQNSEVSL
jgi:hypothetical protein